MVTGGCEKTKEFIPSARAAGDPAADGDIPEARRGGLRVGLTLLALAATHTYTQHTCFPF
jgi:hypothetical protein